MTTITSDQLVQSNPRSVRHIVGGFLAGVVLASGAFFGVHAMTGDSSSKPAPAVGEQSTPSAHVTPANAQDCRLVQGPC
jgi:hypothetical protein